MNIKKYYGWACVVEILDNAQQNNLMYCSMYQTIVFYVDIFCTKWLIIVLHNEIIVLISENKYSWFVNHLSKLNLTHWMKILKNVQYITKI